MYKFLLLDSFEFFRELSLLWFFGTLSIFDFEEVSGDRSVSPSVGVPISTTLELGCPLDSPLPLFESAPGINSLAALNSLSSPPQLVHQFRLLPLQYICTERSTTSRAPPHKPSDKMKTGRGSATHR